MTGWDGTLTYKTLYTKNFFLVSSRLCLVHLALYHLTCVTLFVSLVSFHTLLLRLPQVDFMV